MIPRFCLIKIGCKCNGQIIKWNVYLMIPRLCLIKIGCKCTREIIKWKSRMLQKTETSLLHGKNRAWRNKGPDIAISARVVSCLDANKYDTPRNTSQVGGVSARKPLIVFCSHLLFKIKKKPRLQLHG